ILKGIADFGNYLFGLWIRVRASAALPRDLFRHLLGLYMSFFSRLRTGELVSRLEADANATTAGLETIVGTVLTAPLLIAFYAYLMVRTSPMLVGAAVGAVLLHYGLSRFVRGPIRKFAIHQFSAFADLAARFQEAILSIRVVKSFGAEGFELARLGQVLQRVVHVNVKFGVYKHVPEPARVIVNYVVEAALLLLAAWELLAGRLGTPAFFLFLYVGRAAMTQLSMLGAAYTSMHSTLAASSRIDELLRIARALTDGAGTITEFRDRLVVRAAQIANAHDFIMALTNGYETMVGDRGIRLSGGQRQRVAIARAIVANPQILILDEATSSLDSEAERLVQQAIDRVIEGTTSIVIAHRLSTVLHADKILVVNRGTVEAMGRHTELLASNETYARLYRLQFAEVEALGNR